MKEFVIWLLSYFKYQPKTALLMIDGDNVSINSIRTIIKSLQQIQALEIEIFCNEDSVRGWIKHKAPELDNAIYHVTVSEPQAVDLKMNARIIRILAENTNKLLSHRRIYFCSNDSGYRSALFYMAKVLPVTVLSKTKCILNIKNVESIKLKSEIDKKIVFDTGLVKVSMSLVNIGNLLKEKGVTYGKLSKFLLQNGFELQNERVSKVPIANQYS